MTVLSQQQGHHPGHATMTNLRRMTRSTSSDDIVVHLLASLREEPTGLNDPFNSDILRKILRGNEKQFRRMFRLSCLVFVNLQITKLSAAERAHDRRVT